MKDFIASISAGQITFWIAVVSFAMSLASWVKDWLTQRKRLKARIVFMNALEHTVHMYLMLENKSRLPIAVTNIELILNENRTPCVPLPTLFFRQSKRSGDKVIEQRSEFSTALPIQLPGLGALTALVRFEKLEQTLPPDATHLTLLISTNRGRKARKTLALPQAWADQRIPRW